MSNKLEVGMYVRTFDGYIDKIVDIIEEGDYVNGIYIDKNNGKYLETSETDYEDSSLGHIRYIRIWNDDIGEVLTHEQYEATAYKLGGRD